MRANVWRPDKPIPMSSGPDRSQVEELRQWLDGRSVVIVGSAPLSFKTVGGLTDEEIPIPVNGGISSVNGDVPFWVVNSKAQDAPGANIRPMHRIMLEQARGRHVGHAVFLRGPKVASEQSTLQTLQNMRCFVDSYSVVDKPTKRWLEGEVCGRVDEKKPCSSGILTAAMALWCGARSVRLVGFSFKPGYQYLPNEKPQSWWRDHVAADRQALIALRERFGSRVTGECLTEESGSSQSFQRRTETQHRIGVGGQT